MNCAYQQLSLFCSFTNSLVVLETAVLVSRPKFCGLVLGTWGLGLIQWRPPPDSYCRHNSYRLLLLLLRRPISG